MSFYALKFSQNYETFKTVVLSTLDILFNLEACLPVSNSYEF